MQHHIPIAERLATATKIVLLSVALAVTYGILHDQITVRICREYFTIGHPLIFGDQPSTILAILWGVVATWWMGLFLGVLLAIAATAGPYKMPTLGALTIRMLKLLGVMAGSAIASGFVGFALASSGHTALNSPWSDMPDSRQAGFIADGFAHTASYGVGFIGGLAIAVQTWRLRRMEQKNKSSV